MNEEQISLFIETTNSILEGVNVTDGDPVQISRQDYDENRKLNELGIDSLGIYELYLHLESHYNIDPKIVRIYLEDTELKFLLLQNALAFVETHKQ